MSGPTFVPQSAARRLRIISDEMLVLLTGADSGNTISLFEQRTLPGGGVPMHVHDREDELFQILEGSVEFTIGGTSGSTFVANPGDTVWGPRGIPHAWKVVGDAKARVLVGATPSGVERMFEELSRLPSGAPDFAKIAAVCATHGVHFV